MFLFKAHDQTSRRRQISRATVQDTETVDSPETVERVETVASRCKLHVDFLC